jgi:hypothetical protein
MNDALELVLGKLQGTRASGGAWMARCPAHDDGTASLSVREGTQQPVLLHCHAGCGLDAVLDAIGLTSASISAPRERPGPSVVAEYRYTDEQGTVLFVKERRVPKDFRVKRPDGKGGWAYNLGGTRRVLYNLPAVLAATKAGQVVYITEGEKDADAITGAGATATTNFEGASKNGQQAKWRPEYGDVLTGARVVIIADRDEPGYAHAAAILADLTGKAASAVVVQAAGGKDAYDHLAAGHGLGDFLPVAGAAAAEPVTLPAVPRYPVASLVGPLRAFVGWAIRDGLHPEAAGAAGLAALVTLTGPATLKLSDVKEARAILWIPLIGIASSGKSPVFDHAFARIRDHYADRYETYRSLLEGWEARRGTDGEKAGTRPARPQPLEYDDTTMEAVARWLLARKDNGNDASGAVIDDELAATLEGLNQYKGGQGSDRSKWLKLWTGADLSIQRVGSGGARNEVHIYVRKPVCSLAGNMTPDNAHLMGKQGSGFRPRFLPHLAPAEAPEWHNAGPHPVEWTECIDQLLENREPREWRLAGGAMTEWASARARWRRQQDEAEPDDVIEALRKADAQCYRIALVIAESLNPGAGGDIPVSAVRCAVAIVDYVMGCWRALPGTNTMASSRAEDVMDSMSARLLTWLDSRPAGCEGLPAGSRPRPRAARREVQQWSHLKAANVAALLREHESRYPGCVVSAGGREGDGKGSAGGIPTVYVYAPERESFGVAATPNKRVYTRAQGEGTAGQDTADSVLRTATPNVRNSESATPNNGPPDQWDSWPDASVGAEASR